MDHACREVDPIAVVQSKDNGIKVLVIKGKLNAQGAFLRISETLRKAESLRLSS